MRAGRWEWAVCACVVYAYHQHNRDNNLSYCIAFACDQHPYAILTFTPKIASIGIGIAPKTVCVCTYLEYTAFTRPSTRYDLIVVVFAAAVVFFLSFAAIANCRFFAQPNVLKYGGFPQFISYIFFGYTLSSGEHMTVFGFYGLPFPYVTQRYNFLFAQCERVSLCVYMLEMHIQLCTTVDLCRYSKPHRTLISNFNHTYVYSFYTPLAAHVVCVCVCFFARPMH